MRKSTAKLHSSAIIFSAAAMLALFAILSFALPSVTYVSPTLSDNATTGLNWVFVNVTSTEDLNQSLLEWGNSTGFTNVSMDNSSLTNWYANMTDLADGTYNYTVWAENTTGGWNWTERRYVTIDTILPQISFISPTPANDTNQTWGTITINVSITETNPDKLILNWNGTNTTYNYSEAFWNTTKSDHSFTSSFISLQPAVRDGNYSYYVWINDTAGNSNRTETRTITINGTDGIQGLIDALPADGGVVQLENRVYSLNN